MHNFLIKFFLDTQFCLFYFSASFMFWLGGTDQFVSDQTWYWVQTEQKINNGYTDWYRTEPDHPGIYFLNLCLILYL